MTDLSDALYGYLMLDANVTALVGSRVFPIARPQEADLPAVVYRLIETNRDYTQEGWNGRSMPVYQFHVHASSYSSGRAVAASLVASLLRFRGWADIRCYRTFVEAGSEGYMPELLEFRFDVRAELEIEEVV